MDLLIRAIIGFALILFLQHGYSAIVGGRSVIDSIVEAIGKIPPSERNDGVTGKIAPPANRVPPKNELPKDQESSDGAQSQKTEAG